MGEQWTEKSADDVLASIRRLVSQRSVPVEPAPQPQAETEAVEEKLVLTSAYRIEYGEDKDEITAPPAEQDADASVWSLEDRIAELEAAVGGDADVWEPDGSEEDGEETPTKFVFQHREPEMVDAQPDPTPAMRATQDAPAEEAVAEAAEVPKQSEDASAEADVVAEAPFVEVDESDAETELSSVVEMPGVAKVEVAEGQEEAEVPDAAGEAEQNSEAIPEAANDNAAALIEADSDDTPQDRVFQDADPKADPNPLAELTASNLAGQLDEEDLRDLVAEIVREELQGELGHKITRNVRKLVRREIHRALMSLDLSQDD